MIYTVWFSFVFVSFAGLTYNVHVVRFNAALLTVLVMSLLLGEVSIFTSSGSTSQYCGQKIMQL